MSVTLHPRLEREFYLAPAMEVVTIFLGKVLVHHTSLGRPSGVICDVEAYPAFTVGVTRSRSR